MRPLSARAMTRAMRVRTPDGPGTPPWVIVLQDVTGERLATAEDHLIGAGRDLDAIRGTFLAGADTR